MWQAAGVSGAPAQCEESHHLLSLGLSLSLLLFKMAMTIPTSDGCRGNLSRAQATGGILSVWTPILM